MSATGSTHWFLSRRFAQVCWIVLAVGVCVEGVHTVCFKDNDFEWHYWAGQAFLEGTAYRDPSVAHYPVSRMMFSSLLALTEYRIARACCYVISICMLWYCFRTWRRVWISSSSRPNAGGIALAAVFFSIGLLYPHIVRDLDDCGLQTVVLFLLTGCFWAWQRGKIVAAGAWLAGSASYKVTPALMFGYAIWKRKWSVATACVAWVVVLNVAPALYLGWEKTAQAHRQWLACVRQSLSQPDPSQVSFEPPRHQNQSLKMALARFFQTYPEGHPLYIDHVLFAQFGDLEVNQAKKAVLAGLLIFGVTLAWRMRRRWEDLDDRSQFKEFACVLILCAILSPLCWLQHLILMLPGVYALVYELLEQRTSGMKVSRVHAFLLAAIAFIVLGLQRDVVGRELSLIVLSYKLDTLSALLTIIAMLLPIRHAEEQPAILSIPSVPLQKAA